MRLRSRLRQALRPIGGWALPPDARRRAYGWSSFRRIGRRWRRVQR